MARRVAWRGVASWRGVGVAWRIVVGRGVAWSSSGRRRRVGELVVVASTSRRRSSSRRRVVVVVA
ncbi:hypothetical protein ACXZ9C_11645 [Streptococcus agalactiae]